MYIVSKRKINSEMRNEFSVIFLQLKPYTLSNHMMLAKPID